MDTKLTIRLNKEIIERAKSYAANHHTSLSKLIEFYLDSITKEESMEIEVTPLVASLSGVIQLDNKPDPKEAYRDYLKNKYK